MIYVVNRPVDIFHHCFLDCDWVFIESPRRSSEKKRHLLAVDRGTSKQSRKCFPNYSLLG